MFIGITGGSASGKTLICNNIQQRTKKKVVVLSGDYWYKNHNKNFDHPGAFDVDEMLDCIKRLKNKQPATHPVYDYLTHSRTNVLVEIPDADCYIFEGILMLHDPRIRAEFDYKIFVDAAPDTRLIRRITRDIRERGRTLDDVIAQHVSTVEPGYKKYILPTKEYANFVIQNNSNTFEDSIVKFIANAI